MSQPEHYNYGPIISTVITVTYVIATVFVVLRLISRSRITRHVAIDDWLCIASWVLATALSSVGWLGMSMGWGSSTAGSDTGAVLAGLHAFTIIYPVAHALPKLSVLVYYLSISRTSQVFRNSTLAIIVVLALTTIIVTGAIAAVRGDQMVLWDKTTRIYLGSSPANILVDMLLPLLPIPTIHRQLVLPRRQKLIIYATLGCGGFLGIISVFRVVLLQRAMIAVSSEDWAGYAKFSILAALWTFVDVNLSVAVTCVPALKPLFLRLIPSLFKTDAIASKPSAGAVTPPDKSPNPEQEYSEKTLQVSQMSFNAMLNVPDSTEIGTSAFAEAMEAKRASCSDEESQGANLNFLEARHRFTLHSVPASQSWKFLWTTSILFLLIGFANSFVEALTQCAKAEQVITKDFAFINRAVFYGSYLVAPPIVALPIMKRWSFKGSSMAGLLIFALGCLIFWPAATLGPSNAAVAFSYGIVGSGTAIIETGATLYSFLAGPPQFATSRVLIMHSFQALGSVLAPLVVRQTIPTANVTIVGPFLASWSYLVLACLAFLLLFWYQCFPANLMNDEELEEDFKESDPKLYEKLRRHPLQVYSTLALCVVGTLAYTGAQETGHTTLGGLLKQANWGIDMLAFEALSRSVMALSTFGFGVLAIYVKPRSILTGCASIALVCSTLAMRLTGPAVVVVYLLEVVGQSSIWPIGFAMAAQSMGKRARHAAVLSVMAGSGGLIFPSITYGLQRSGRGYQGVQPITISCFVVVFVWSLVINIWPIARLKVDGWAKTEEQHTTGHPVGLKTQRKQKKKTAAKPQFSMDFITTANGEEDKDDVSYGRGVVPIPRRVSQALDFVTQAIPRGAHEMQPYRKLSSAEPS